MKHRTDPRQAGQSQDPLSSVPRVNIAGSHVRSVSHGMLYAASVFFLLQSMGALGIIDRSIYGQWNGKTGDKITETLNLLGILASLFLFWSGTRTTRIARVNRVLPLAAASLLLISFLWSADPRVTLTQGMAYFFVVLGAIGLAESLDSDVLMDLLALLCGLSAIASLVQFLGFPEPVAVSGGDFRGIFPQKNVLGLVMVVGVLAALHAARSKHAGRFRYICVIALCTIVAFMSKSGTAIMTIMVFFLLDVLGRPYLRGGSSRIISVWLTIVCVPFVIFFVMNADLIFQLLGKDATLTGRTLLWPYVIDKISEKPVLGWGYYGFWSYLNPFTFQIADATGIGVVPNSHNTILEMLLGIGFVGTSFFIFLWVRNFVLAVKCMHGPGGQFGLSSVLLLIGILLIGMSEVVLLSPGQIWTTLFFTMGFICEKELWLAHAARTRGRPRPRSTLAAAATSRSAIRQLR